MSTTAPAGSLAVAITADMRAFMAQVATKSTVGGTAAGASFGKKFVAGLAAVGAGVAVAKFIGSSITAAGDFQQTMNVFQANANASGDEMARMSDLALKMGQDTVFSAGEAGEAMLELAKAGLTPAQIEAGALEQALNLAATEGIGMSDAATIMSNALNTYGMKAGQAVEVSDALAGASKSSSAGVMDIAQALAQVGPGAVDAGLSIQDTTAALAAFADQGIKGSDAGTSLKTFLARLVPQTETAAAGFKTLGLELTDSEGNFKSLAAISEELRQGVKGLSDEERTAALNAAFGSDARRAALILSKEGAQGLKEYTDATNKAGTAEKLGAARMDGYAGAMESFKGSVETLQIQLGTYLLPVVTAIMNGLTGFVNAIIPAAQWVAKWWPEILIVGTAIAAATIAINAQTIAIGAYLMWSKLAAAASKAWAAATAILNAVMAMNPITLIIIAIIALVAVFVLAYRHSETFRNIVQAAWAFIQAAAQAFVDWIKSTLWPFLQQLYVIFRVTWARIVNAVTTAWDWIEKTILPPLKKISGYIMGALKTWWSIFSTYWKLIWAVVKVAVGIIIGIIKIAFKILAPIVKVGWKIVSTIFKVAWKVISTIVKAAWKVISTIFKVAFAVIKPIVKVGWTVIKTIFTTVVKIIVGAVKAFWNVLKSVFQTGINVIKGIWDRIRDFVNIVRNVFSAVVEVVGEKVGAALDKIKSWWDNVVAFFDGLWDKMYNMGKDLVQGLIDGLDSMIDAVVEKAKEVGKAATNPIGWVMELGSPSRLTRRMGQAAGEGLRLGLDDSRASIDAAARRMVGGIGGAGAGNQNVTSQWASGLGSGDATVRVFIGERELTDIVRVEVEHETAAVGARYRHRRN